MKRLFFIVTILFGLNVQAQLTVAEDSVYAVYDTNEEDVAVHNFHLTSTPTATVKWMLLEVDVPTNWENDAFICDAINCYDSTTNSNQYDLIDNKQKTLDVHFLNNQFVGEGKVKLLIWDVNDSINTVTTVTYVAKVEAPSAIQAVNEIEVSIFPNPATKFVNINNVDISVINKIEIYNVIGRKVFESKNLSSDNKIDFNDFNKGVYILKLLDVNNNNYYTKNIIKK
tara:strand:+ start:74 stop:754 length:681 start_codon:yes stop_codon:yes gene_type:complete